ncbi:two-component regulator propeller domain-containing protein [Rhodanobacter sp. L36]|uniref:sensor histidine kinase n=1 Tax=Rhodanobacter sp. L36 TaxID=1747221 RepID=UPI00131AC507|nr:two-component regulator propeller domain-containing protein [Rhodanobacter sp. L36]
MNFAQTKASAEMCCRTMRLAKLLVAMLCVVFPFHSALALDTTKAITQYVHTVWRTDDGLPENSVNKIIETPDGYLWVGTQAGLARFDGTHFKVFDHTNTASLHNDYIVDLAQDRQETLWIATSNGGVTAFRDGIFSHVRAIGFRAGLALAADNDGGMWVGGYGGLSHLKNGKVIKTYGAADGLIGDPVRRLVMGKDGSLWIGTAGGLNHLVDDKIRTYSTKDGLPDNYIDNLHLGADGTLWVQTQSSEIVRLMHDHFVPWRVPGVSGPTGDMLEDRARNLWLASTTEGLVRVSGQQVSRFTTKDGLSSNLVNTLYEDHAGNLWVGTNEGGLDRFRDGSFTSYAKEEGLAADQTYSVIEDHSGDIWVTTAAGLNRLHINQVRVFTTADGLPTNNTWSMWEDLKKNLWVGTSSGGVIRMIHGRFTQALSIHDGIPAYMIGAGVEDQAGHFWFSTRGGGLVRYVDGRTSLYSRENGLLSNFIYAIAQDPRGILWVGSTGGLNSIQNGHVTSYAADGLSDAAVLTLYIDAKNIVWIGTMGGGLFRLKNDHFTRFTTRQGLPDDTINNILEDAEANLWIGSNKGIFRISRSDLDAVADGARRSVQPLVFGKADGMKSSETNAGSQPSGWHARDGRLWFPTIQGVVVVDPDTLSLSDHQPSTRIEQLIADEVDIDLTAPVRLAPGTRRLEIHYTAPNLSSPERTRFRYRLEGFDEKWVTGGTQRIAQYTNLPPGTYTFHVSASADTGFWGTQASSFNFQVLPQFYQTWWFRLLSGVVATMALVGFYRLRVNWLHARAAVLEERQRMAGEIHDSLAQGLSGIIFQTEAALLTMKRTQLKTRAYIQSACDLARSSLKEARTSVWNLSSAEPDEKSLLESLSTVAQQLASGRVDEVRVHSSGTARLLHPRVENHVVRIVQQAVSNAIEHGKAHVISIDLTYAPSALRVEVTDNGVGFRSNVSGKRERGFGLKNMRHRSAQMGARIEVTSETGRGTRVFLNLPTGNVLARLWHHLSVRNTGEPIDDR